MKSARKWPGGDVGETHPSYGMAHFSRRTGNPGHLFGSSLEDHHSYVTLQISSGECVTSDHGNVRYYGGHRGDLIEVDLSAAQFAELLTGMSVGSGVPCTVRILDGKRVEKPPVGKVEVEKVRDAFREKVRATQDSSRKDAEEICALLDKKAPLTVGERKSIKDKIATMFREVGDNTPYILTLFEEAAERVVSSAKAEIDAFAVQNVMAAGIRALAEDLAKAPNNNLPTGEVVDVPQLEKGSDEG